MVSRAARTLRHIWCPRGVRIFTHWILSEWASAGSWAWSSCLTTGRSCRGLGDGARPADSTGARNSRRPNPSKSKQNQINPSKIAWICLVLFVRNRDFSMGYARKNKKEFGPLSQVVLKPSQAAFRHPLVSATLSSRARARRRQGAWASIPTLRNTLAYHSVFRQAFSYTPPSSAIAKCEPVIVRSECARQSLDRIPACGACRRRRRGSSRPPGRRRSRSNRSHWRGRHRRYSA